MQTIKKSSPRSNLINMRISENNRWLIDQAAKVKGKNRTEFILDTAVSEAENVILDQSFLLVDEEKFNNFIKILEMPVKYNERLAKTMQTPAPWEDS